jgi:hypothetical protein
MTKTFAAVVLAALVLTTATRAADPPSRPDPALVKAYAAAEAIKGTEAKQEKLEADLIRDLDTFLAAAGPLTPELEKLTVEKTRAVAAGLHAMGKRLVAFHKDYEASNKTVAAAYAQAPPAFRAAGVTFRKFAAEEPYEEIKHDYVRLAEICDTLATRYEKRVAALPDEAKEIRETMKFVERTVLYLERHDALAASFPDLSVGADREKFLDTLKKYIDGYKDLRGSMDKFHEKLKEQAMDPRLRPADKGATALVSKTPTAVPSKSAPTPDGKPVPPASALPTPDLAALIASSRRK